MTAVKLFPMDIYNQKTNSAGPLVGLDQQRRRRIRPVGAERRAGRSRRCDDRSGGRAPRRDDGAAVDRWNLCQFRLHAEQGAHSLRSRRSRCGPRDRIRLSARRSAPDGLRRGHGTRPADAFPEQPGDAVQVVEQAGAEVYLGHTRFIAPNIVEVDGRELRFRKAVIATGSDPLIPPIDGLQSGEYLTNESVFSLTELPPRLVVIGSGPLACELAQAFRRLGSEVDLVSTTKSLMPRDEPEAGELIRRRFEQEGLRLHLGFKAVRVVAA